MTDFLQVLTAGGRRDDRLRHLHESAARSGTAAPWPSWVPDAVRQGYASLGISAPWTHQVTAAQAAHYGHHTVIATGTGSGKSLAYWLPVLSAPPTATALYLSPTKALAADQLHALTRLIDAAGVPVAAAACDGDTPHEARQWARERAQILLTNPDFLNHAILPDHERWKRFMRQVRYVVVDEAHVFRGMFGAHVSLVLRRLLRLLRHYGAEPVVICASATMATPGTTAARLIGCAPEDVIEVTENSAPQGVRRLVLWEPGLVDATAGIDAVHALTGVSPDADDADNALVAVETQRVPAISEAVTLLADLAAHGARCLAFTRSRRAAETLAQAVREELSASHPQFSARVAAYRGGYLPEERRALEQQLRSGELAVLTSTNALELGIDISGLDAVVMVGWPGTRMSLWQQAGRAGRGSQPGLAVFVGREEPLDAYLVNHPASVIDEPVEAAVMDPSNPYVLTPHLCAAAAELPLLPADLQQLVGSGGDVSQAEDLLQVMAARGAVRLRPTGWHWVLRKRAASFVDLRGGGAATVQVVDEDTGQLLGTVDGSSADATVHPGAVYVHQGAEYVVTDWDEPGGLAQVRRAAVDYTTWAKWSTSISINTVKEEAAWNDVMWARGLVNVETQVTNFQRRRKGSREVIATIPLDLPQRVLSTAGTWVNVTSQILEDAKIEATDIPGSLHAAEHAMISMLPLLAMCDRWDLGGVSTAWHPDTDTATIFVHDAVPGGAGFAQRGFDSAQLWLEMTHAAIADCPCAVGCPRCVQSPKCGNGNEPLYKAGALSLLEALLAKKS